MEDGKRDLFDEQWYLKRYEDVRLGVAAGTFKSALEHYILHGRREGRVPIPFDSEWYLSTNIDVRKAVDTGVIESPFEHYLRHGLSEFRPALPPSFPDGYLTFAHGAFGTNNIGDDAIFEGLRREFPNIIQIFHHKPTWPHGIQVEQALAYKKLFHSDCRLILGGGGLLYSRSAVLDMLALALAARERGAMVDILGLGAEGAAEPYFDDIRRLIELATTVSVRTTTSAEIILEITGRAPTIRRDFAWNLAPDLPASAGNLAEGALIGVVTGGDIREDISFLIELLNSQFIGNPDQRVRFIHIPHSRSFDDRYNNDIIVGHALWSDVALAGKRDENFIDVAPFPASPWDALRIYASLDAVMSARFHGMLFGRMMGLPVLALEPNTRKNHAFIIDNAHPDLLSFDPKAGQDGFNRFISLVKDRRRLRAGL